MDILEPAQVRVSQRLGQSSPLYQAFSNIRNNSTGLTETQQRIVDGVIVNAKQSGVDLQVIKAALPVPHSVELLCPENMPATLTPYKSFGQTNIDMSMLAGRPDCCARRRGQREGQGRGLKPVQ